MYSDRPMSGSEIADALGGMSRQAVSNVLKKAMKKYYKEVRKLDPSWTPFECICTMMKMFHVPNDDAEIKKFFQLFPPDVKKEVTEDLVNRNNGN
jgi:hypothetical protein